MRYTVFEDVKATSMTQHDGSWAEFQDLITGAPRGPKSQARLVKMAEFDGKQNAKNCYRTDESMVSICGIECDYDGGHVTPYEAAYLLRQAGIQAAVITTHGHTPQAPRWRVYAPTSVTLPPEARLELVERMNTVLGGILAGESFTASQAFYIGGPADESIEWIFLHSVATGYIDQMVDIPRTPKTATIHQLHPTSDFDHEPGVAFAEPTRTLTDADLISKICSGDDIHGNMLILFGRMVHRGDSPAMMHIAAIGMATEIQKSRGVERAQEFMSEVRRAVRGAVEKGYRVEPKIPKGELLVRPGQGQLVKSNTLIRNILPEVGVGVVWGEPGSFKSFIVLDMALSVVHGLPWHGHPATQGRVWLISGEGQGGLDVRLRAWHKLKGMDMPDDDSFLYTPRGLTLNADGKPSPETQALIELIEEGNIPDMILVDTVARSMTGDENSAQDMGSYIAAVDAIRDAVTTAGGRCCIVLVHHSRKDGNSYRGSSALKGAVDFEYEVSRGEGDDLPVIMICHKQKDMEEPRPVSMVMLRVNMGAVTDNHGVTEDLISLVPTQDMTEASEREVQSLQLEYDHIREAILGGLTGTNAIAKHCEWSKRKAVGALSKLVELGRLTVTKHGQSNAYSLVEEMTSVVDM